MHRGLNSWTIDHDDRLDPTDFHNQQKEIEVALSSAFDDVSNLSDITDSEEEYPNEPPKVRQNGTKLGSDFTANHLSSSTPMRLQNGAFCGNKLSDYRHNISDVLEETESYIPPSDSHFKGHNDRVLPFSGEEEQSKADTGLEDYFNKEKISSSLLVENDKLSKQLFNLKRKFSTISTNYETLQDKFHQLFKENKTNVEIIEQLESKVNTLEFKLKEERHCSEHLNKKTSFLESQIDSLEDALSEHRKSDFVARTNDAQEIILANLKQKQENDLSLLRSEIEHLTQQLNVKEEEIMAKSAMVERYNEKFVSESLQRMMEMFRNEMREQNDPEMSNNKSKEKMRLELLQSFDQRIAALKGDWLQQLHDDVNKIILWVNDNERLGASEQRTVSVEFVPLKRLCDCLHQLLTEREHKIELQIAKFKETKLQLEEALIESRMSSSNLSSHSDKSQSLDELRCELNRFKQDSQLLAHKLNKYKQHYRLLEKKHQQEIELLKSQFSTYIRSKQNKIANN